MLKFSLIFRARQIFRLALISGFSRLRFVFAALLLAPAILNSGAAQESLKGATPSGLTPGAPAGSYSLSGFETINPYNGGLNFNLPLVSVGGRGSAGASVNLEIEQKWMVETDYGDGSYTPISYANYNRWIPGDVYYAGARIDGRTGGSGTVTCGSALMKGGSFILKL
jgi:hypothetical protein